MTREEMMDKVIGMLGFEDKNTIWFCGLCEDKSLSDKALSLAMAVALSTPITEEE